MQFIGQVLSVYLGMVTALKKDISALEANADFIELRKDQEGFGIDIWKAWEKALDGGLRRTLGNRGFEFETPEQFLTFVTQRVTCSRTGDPNYFGGESFSYYLDQRLPDQGDLLLVINTGCKIDRARVDEVIVEFEINLA